MLSHFRPAPLNLKENPVEVGLIVNNVPPYLAKSLLVGQDLFQDTTDNYLGKIYLKRAVPAELLLNVDGKLALVAAPRNLDLRLVIRRKARIIVGPAHTGVYFGRQALRVGDAIRAHTRYSSIRATVESLKVNP